METKELKEAKELVDKYTKYMKTKFHSNRLALIYVNDRLDEINKWLEENEGDSFNNLGMWNFHIGKLRYWGRVKEILNKL